MEGTGYITQYLYFLIFPAAFFVIRCAELQNLGFMNRVKFIWLILSSVVLGVCWRVASLDAFGFGLSLSDLGSMLIASIYFFVLACLFIIPDLIELRKVSNRKERQRVQRMCIKLALDRIGPYTLAICVLNTLQGLHRYYADEVEQWAGGLGLLGVLILLLPVLLYLATWVINPLFYYFSLSRSLNDVENAVKHCINRELLRMLQQQYGLSISVARVIQDGYTAYNRQEFASNPQWDYRYRFDWRELVHEDAPVQWVTNEDRAERILENLAELMEQPNGERASLQTAETIISGIAQEKETHIRQGSLGKVLNALALQWPAQQSHTLGNFFQTRCSEIQAIAQAQLQAYANDYRGIRAGIDGEEEVRQALDALGGAILPLYNLRLEFPGKDGSVNSVEVDSLVLAPNGIFALEVKNFGAYRSSYEIVVAQDGSWYKEFTNKSKTSREQMESPFRQNARHTSYLEQFVNQLLGRSVSNWIPVEGIVVLANDKVRVRVEPGAPQAPTRIGTLYSRLRQNMSPVLSEDELRQLASAFEARNLPPNKYPLYDYRSEIRQLSMDCDKLRAVAQESAQKIQTCLKEHPEYRRYLNL